MVIRKTASTKYGTYFIEVEFFPENYNYKLQIYDAPPHYKVFGVTMTRDPIIRRYFDMRVNPKEKAEELIREYELPMTYKEEMHKWDGQITEEPRKQQEPAAIIEEQFDWEEENKPIIHDWREGIIQHPDKRVVLMNRARRTGT